MDPARYTSVACTTTIVNSNSETFEWSSEAIELAHIVDNEEAVDVLSFIEDNKCPVSMPLPPNGRTLLHHYARLNEYEYKNKHS
jgi:hypothetical protein